MRTLRFALALLSVVPMALAPNALRAQQPVTIAILPLSAFALGQDAASQAALASALRDMLISEFAQNAKLKAIDRNAVDEILKSRNMSLSGKLTDDDAKQVGQLLGAQYWIGGGMTVSGNTARMDLRLVDTESSEIVSTAKETGKKDDMIATVEKVAADFSTHAKWKPRVVAVVVPVPSIFAYSRGLDYERRGNKTKAAEMYRSALTLSPANAAAKAALDRVK
ncbi:MAG: FlgO family outer membrane protein [Longimicrobiales bacterium]